MRPEESAASNAGSGTTAVDDATQFEDVPLPATEFIEPQLGPGTFEENTFAIGAGLIPDVENQAPNVAIQHPPNVFQRLLTALTDFVPRLFSPLSRTLEQPTSGSVHLVAMSAGEFDTSPIPRQYQHIPQADDQPDPRSHDIAAIVQRSLSPFTSRERARNVMLFWVLVMSALLTRVVYRLGRSYFEHGVPQSATVPIILALLMIAFGLIFAWNLGWRPYGYVFILLLSVATLAAYLSLEVHLDLAVP